MALGLAEPSAASDVAGLRRSGDGHNKDMTPVLIVALVLTAWCVLSLPVAIVVGRAFRSGQQSDVDVAFAEIVRRYEAADVSATDSTRAL